MTTNFALSLSFEGIELLHRVPRGWQVVGTADVEDKNLDAALAALREKALALEPGNLRTKLVIPMDQIKYLAIDSTQTNLDDIHAALDGATPYDLNELAVDYERSGGRTHVAAVARDTLEEAESFASAHQFNPVAFVAVPEPFTFQKEVFFGATTCAAQIVGSDVISRDDLPVLKVGTRIKSRLLIMSDLVDDEPESPGEFNLADALAPFVSPPPVADIAIAVPVAPEVIPHPDVLPAPEAVAAPAPRSVQIDRIVPEFHAPVAPVTPPVIVIPEAVTDTRPILPENPVLADISGLHRMIPEYHAKTAKAGRLILSASAPAASRNIPTLGAATPFKTPVTDSASRRTTVIFAALAASVAAAAVFAWSQYSAAPIASVDSRAAASETIAPVELQIVATPDAAVTVTGADLATLAPPVIPTASITAPEPVNIFTVPNTPEAIIVSLQDGLPDIATATPPPPPAEPVAQTNADTPAPVIGQVLSPADAQAAYDATGVWQRAPRMIDTPRIAQGPDFTPPADLPPATQRVAQAPAIPDMSPDLSFVAPVNPPSADAVFALDDNGQIIPSTEGTITPEGAVVYAGLPDLRVRVRPELSEEDLARFAPPVAPTSGGVVVIAGAPDVVPPARPDDLVATPEDPAPTAGAVGLGGLSTQDNAAEALIATAPNNVVRPQPRPQDLAAVAPLPAPSDAATPDITAIIASVMEEDARQPFIDMTAQAVSTSRRPTMRPRNFDRVVAAARARQAAQPTQTASAPAAAPAPVAAAPVAPQNYAPVPGGVARAATEDNAINLREINLIGIYGRPSAPRALVRLSNGRYEHVEVGSALDGGQVTAIGDGVLNYVKRGRTISLQALGG